MIKKIFKEAFIIILLCIAILLVLSILFYEYNPIAKVVPSKIAYSTPEDISEKIDVNDINTTIDNQKRVYTIDGSDLTKYQKSKAYDPSKENPFLSVSEGNASTNVNTNGSSGNSSSGTSSGTTSSTSVKGSTKSK